MRSACDQLHTQHLAGTLRMIRSPPPTLYHAQLYHVTFDQMQRQLVHPVVGFQCRMLTSFPLHDVTNFRARQADVVSQDFNHFH